MKSRISSYREQFNQIFSGNPWIDESFHKKLDNLSDVQVFFESPGHNHSVAEVVSHITEWRREIIRRLNYNSSERMLTVQSVNNWIPLQQLKETGWDQLYAALRESQQEINNLLDDKDDIFLDELLAGTEFNKEYFVAGLLHHDVYHLGQIGLILKFVEYNLKVQSPKT